MPPTNGQLALLAFSVVLFVLGGTASFLRFWSPRPKLALAATACLYTGLVASAGVLLWHLLSRGQWQPLNDNFAALVWLAVLLTLFVVYTQRVWPVAGLDWFVMPVAVLLLVGAGVFGRLDYHTYRSMGKNTWVWVHHASGYIGAVAFAIGAAEGAMYMISSRLLRRKVTTGPRFGSLERLEWIMMAAVTVGFALLTVSLITGYVKMLDENAPMPHSKLLLASLAWVVYAVVMHAPINPRFRGRRAAILSVLGFVLMIGTLIAVQFMPGGRS